VNESTVITDNYCRTDAWFRIFIPPSSTWRPCVACMAGGRAACTWSTTVTADVGRPWRVKSPGRVDRSAGRGRQTRVESSRRRQWREAWRSTARRPGSTLHPAVTRRNRAMTRSTQRHVGSSSVVTWWCASSSTSSHTAGGLHTSRLTRNDHLASHQRAFDEICGNCRLMLRSSSSYRRSRRS